MQEITGVPHQDLEDPDPPNMDSVDLQHSRASQEVKLHGGFTTLMGLRVKEVSPTEFQLRYQTRTM